MTIAVYCEEDHKTTYNVAVPPKMLLATKWRCKLCKKGYKEVVEIDNNWKEHDS